VQLIHKEQVIFTNMFYTMALSSETVLECVTATSTAKKAILSALTVAFFWIRYIPAEASPSLALLGFTP